MIVRRQILIPQVIAKLLVGTLRMSSRRSFDYLEYICLRIPIVFSFAFISIVNAKSFQKEMTIVNMHERHLFGAFIRT